MTSQQRSRLPIIIGTGASALAIVVGAVLVAPAPAQADPVTDLLCGLLPCPAPAPTTTPTTTPSTSTPAPGTTPSSTPTSAPVVSSGPIVVDVPDPVVTVPPIVVPPIVIGGGGSSTPTTGLPTSVPTTTPTTVPTTVPTSIPDVSTPPTGSTPTTTLPTSSTPSTPSTPAPTTTAPVVAVLRSVVASPDVATVFPVKDGYRDSVSFEVKGTTSIGSAIPVTGRAVLTTNGKTVTTWTLKSSTQRLVWNGRVGKAVKAGTYVLTATMRDAAGDTSTATTRVQVSAQRLVAAAAKVTSAASTGTHVMAAAPRKGLAKATVTLQVTTTATGMKGTQKLVFSKSGKKIVIPVRNGTHTSKAIVVPKALTSFRLTHTWKTGKLVSATYVYKYKVLK